MNFLQFTIGMVLIVSAAYLSINVNWKDELSDMVDVFKAKEKKI